MTKHRKCVLTEATAISCAHGNKHNKCAKNENMELNTENKTTIKIESHTAFNGRFNMQCKSFRKHAIRIIIVTFPLIPCPATTPFIQWFWCALAYLFRSANGKAFVFFSKLNFTLNVEMAVWVSWNTTTLIEIDMLWATQQLEPQLIRRAGFHSSAHCLIWLSFHSRRVAFLSIHGIVFIMKGSHVTAVIG